ncbi:HAMP domain-containing sensor histidine kinase [Lapidilactobacillus wuchangensis]|uniref:HAMP domain-containing sensor histidine kinase n=1 Tax=Lapidilactobacillus wuchangensis TaxID=2486001 RepID=UPI000F7810E3|nr:HAMP domain-containing histidine kinase [Lapidilactobacillus wuchangensis]
MTKKTTATKKKSLRLTLRVKWSAAVGLTIFFTFVIFASIIYATFNNNLLAQEKKTTAETAKLVVDRLGNVKQNLTIAKVVPLMTPEYYQSDNQLDSSDSQNNSDPFYQDSVFNQLSRSDLSVSIYNRQLEQVFTSRDTTVKFKPVSSQTQKIVQENGRRVVVTTMPVYEQPNYRLTGYVIVVNRMDSLYRSTQQLRWQMTLLIVVAVLFSGFIGYLIVHRLLKRINLIADTIHKIDQSPESTARIPQLSGNDEISDLARQFNGMLDQIQQYIEQQKQFVGDVSHELRTPIAVIQGHLQLLNRWGKDDPEVLSESLAAATQETARMNNLIEEMLQLTRAEQVEIKTVHDQTNVQAVISQCVDNIQMLHQDFTIQTDVELAPQTFVRMNRNHLEQIIIILLDNAVKYSASRKEVLLSADSDQQHVNIVVQDFGLGISAKDQQRIFDRFYRVDKARSRERGGNGLGLSIAFRLVKAYGGTLSVESVVDSGSQFKVSLPRDNGPVLPENQPQANNSLDEDLPSGVTRLH